MFREFDDQQSKWRQPVHPSDPFESTTQKPHIQTHIHIQILCLEIDQSLSGNQLEANQYPPKVTQVILHSVEVWERFPRLVDQVVYKTSALQWRRRRSRRSRRRRDLIQLLVLGGETDAHYARKWLPSLCIRDKKIALEKCKKRMPLADLTTVLASFCLLSPPDHRGPESSLRICGRKTGGLPAFGLPPVLAPEATFKAEEQEWVWAVPWVAKILMRKALFNLACLFYVCLCLCLCVCVCVCVCY